MLCCVVLGCVVLCCVSLYITASNPLQMSSGEDRTHHWLLTSPGPGEAVVEDPMVEDDPPAPLHYPLAPSGEDPLAPTPSDAPGKCDVLTPSID